jgi:NAD(P)-dependent dehydrogenase (short-subunit alcohol dehydrogenase family)
MGEPAQIDAAAERIADFGAPQALINNAGIVERATLTELDLASYRRQMDTNVLGPIWLTRAVLPAMRAAAHGRIVNVGSISGTLGSAQQCVYNASKWALLGFTKSLACELTDSGISVVTVLPGAVETDMTKGGPYPPRMSAKDVAGVLLHYALEAPLAHNGASIEMFGD